jgi:hypothetical protein
MIALTITSMPHAMKIPPTSLKFDEFNHAIEPNIIWNTKTSELYFQHLNIAKFLLVECQTLGYGHPYLQKIFDI